MSTHYAGVGSRETPQPILSYFTQLAVHFESCGMTLRSGGAPGADSAFEQGVKSLKQIFLPWSMFSCNPSPFYEPPIVAYDIASAFHPTWDRLPLAVRRLMARNSQQVLGPNCNEPSLFVVCWTKDAAGKGGTGQAIRIANAYNIPVFDFGDVTSAYASMVSFIKGGKK